VDHLASRIISDMNECTTRSRVRNNSHFAHAAFVATFEPKNIGHALSDHNWVNSMHEELLRGTKFGNWLTLPHGVSQLGQNGCGRTKRERKVKW
jgi:hypothetical protein